jgi:hypothetical protein
MTMQTLPFPWLGLMAGSDTVFGAVRVSSDGEGVTVVPETSTMWTVRVKNASLPESVRMATKFAGLPKIRKRTDPSPGFGKKKLPAPFWIEQPGFTPPVVLMMVAPFGVVAVWFPLCQFSPTLMKKPEVMLRQAIMFLRKCENYLCAPARSEIA